MSVHDSTAVESHKNMTIICLAWSTCFIFDDIDKIFSDALVELKNCYFQ